MTEIQEYNGGWLPTRYLAYLYDGWNVIEEIDGLNWVLLGQYTWGLDLSHSLQGAGGIGGLRAAHIPADTCATFAGGQAMGFGGAGFLSDLGIGGAAASPVGSWATAGSPVEVLAAAQVARLSGGYQTDPLAVSSDGGEVQTLTVGGDCDIWYLYDANGNVGQLLRYDAATGGVTLAAAYEYDPYGNTLTVNDVDDSGIAQANKFRFSTKYLHDELTVWGQPGALDTTGLYYYGYRFYSPSLGRWISRDPIEDLNNSRTRQNSIIPEEVRLGLLRASEPMPYLFCKSDPLNVCDLFGLCSSFPDCCWVWRNIGHGDAGQADDSDGNPLTPERMAKICPQLCDGAVLRLENCYALKGEKGEKYAASLMLACPKISQVVGCAGKVHQGPVVIQWPWDALTDADNPAKGCTICKDGPAKCDGGWVTINKESCWYKCGQMCGGNLNCHICSFLCTKP